eukprot:scaffold421184_cov56-Attheya_sp.AAC.10
MAYFKGRHIIETSFFAYRHLSRLAITHVFEGTTGTDTVLYDRGRDALKTMTDHCMPMDCGTESQLEAVD